MLVSFIVKAQPYGVRLMSELDITDIQAAAILGNAGYLSNGAQPNFREDKTYGPSWAKGTLRRGYGWMQWENKSDGTNKLDEFIEYTNTTFNDDITSISANDEHNYSFLVYELVNGNKKLVLTSLKTTSTLDAATTSFMKNYENPDQFSINLNKRMNYAKQALLCISSASVPIRAVGKNLIETNV
jgi:hypothetical protein